MLRYQKGYICNGYTFVVNKEDVHNATDDMFVDATALLPDGWISVKERLPEKTGYYLIACDRPYIGKKDGINISFYQHKVKNWKTTNNLHVTHWMPLPEPPKEEA